MMRNQLFIAGILLSLHTSSVLTSDNEHTSLVPPAHNTTRERTPQCRDYRTWSCTERAAIGGGCSGGILMLISTIFALACTRTASCDSTIYKEHAGYWHEPFNTTVTIFIGTGIGAIMGSTIGALTTCCCEPIDDGE